MHKEVLDWVYTSFHLVKTKDKNDILEIGSLDINGSVRSIFDSFAASYLGLDMQDGPGVDLVADGATYELPEAYDVIVTAETFEHTPDWKKIIQQSYINLRPGGIFIATTPPEGRPPHSAIAGSRSFPGGPNNQPDGGKEQRQADHKGDRADQNRIIRLYKFTLDIFTLCAG